MEKLYESLRVKKPYDDTDEDVKLNKCCSSVCAYRVRK